MGSRAVAADDLVGALDAVRGCLGPVVDRSWAAPAGSLRWDVATTVTHMAAACGRYALSLASLTVRPLALRTERQPGSTPTELVDTLEATVRALSAVVAAAPPGARAYHSMGMADAEGFVAMACTELLVHCGDVATGFGVAFEPPDELCSALTARLFPWAPAGHRGWAQLLWATGRADLPGRPAAAPSWAWHCAPIVEWDGRIPTRRR
jgi:hypothetical protein